MSRTFKISKDPHDMKETLYKKSEITLEPGVTIFVGCNGSGKTTLIHYLKQNLEKQKISTMLYNDRFDGGSNATSAALYWGDTAFAATMMCSSEGERIMLNLGKIAGKIGKFVREHKGEKELWLFFDSIDSGFSIDNIVETKELLFDTIIKDNPGSDVYIIVSANGYEMCKDTDCFDVTGGRYVRFNDYQEYRTFILESRKEKDKRIKKAQTKAKVKTND